MHIYVYTYTPTSSEISVESAPVILTGQIVCMLTPLRCLWGLAAAPRFWEQQASRCMYLPKSICFFSQNASVTVSPQSYLASFFGDGMNLITGVVPIHPKHVLLARPRQFFSALLTKKIFFFFPQTKGSSSPLIFVCLAVVTSREPSWR